MERGCFGRTGLIRMTPEWRQALVPRQGVRRNRRVLVITVLEMVQDLADDAGLGDERNDAHCAAAFFANQRVGFEHTADQVGPSSAKGFTLGGVETRLFCFLGDVPPDVEFGVAAAPWPA